MKRGRKKGLEKRQRDEGEDADNRERDYGAAYLKEQEG